MTQRKVWRYKCDFCKKSNCSKHGMELHEKHCTLNPNRECRMCEDCWPKPELLGVLEGVKDKLHLDWMECDYAEEEETRKRILAEVILQASSCPACILSAIRQAKCEGVFNWDYKPACEEWWREYGSGRAY